MGPQFPDVAAAALAHATTLLSEWIGGRRHGREWKGERKANGGPGDSWCVNLDSGHWLHGASQRAGLDLISLYAALNHIDQLPALMEVAKLVGSTELPISVLPPSQDKPEASCEAIPEPTPAISPHPRHGPPSAVYRYGDAFVVARFDYVDESGRPAKEFRQWTWRNGGWYARGYPAPRPLYNLVELARVPHRPVLVVEGEKCVHAAQQILGTWAIVTWAGGASSVDKNDLRPLHGRDVLIWPDADAPGKQAAATLAQILVGKASRVRVVIVDEFPEGFDLADAIAEGWDVDKITSYATAHIREIDTPPSAAPTSKRAKKKMNGAHPPPEVLPPADPESDYPAGSAPRSAVVAWQDLRLLSDSKGIPHATIANASLIFRFHPAYRGRIWWDEFCERIYHTTRGTPQEWDDTNTMSATTFIQQDLMLPKFTLKTVQDGILHAAHQDVRNSVQDWLDSLRWDGTPRLETWVGDCLGCELTTYSMAVGKNWLISMVARAYKPGCQVDTMPVLEGLQGEGKSSALEILGGRWYSAVGTAFGSYDFISTIQGRWLIEIPDMAGFGRREHSQVIATITTRTDRYRLKYGRFDQDHPRKCVFAATSETDDYLPEMRGYRRYWPLRCLTIDLDALRAQREQLFAEAVHAYRSGATYHAMPKDITASEQRARKTEDLWTEDVLTYCEQRAQAGHPVHPARVLTDSALEIPKRELDHAAKLRVVNILTAYGWIPKTIDNTRMYVKPKRKE